jgi:hypothetical protein
MAAAPVNVDVNMVQQLLESFAAQLEQTGPMSTLLRERWASAFQLLLLQLMVLMCMVLTWLLSSEGGVQFDSTANAHYLVAQLVQYCCTQSSADA